MHERPAHGPCLLMPAARLRGPSSVLTHERPACAGRSSASGRRCTCEVRSPRQYRLAFSTRPKCARRITSSARKGVDAVHPGLDLGERAGDRQVLAEHPVEGVGVVGAQARARRTSGTGRRRCRRRRRPRPSASRGRRAGPRTGAASRAAASLRSCRRCSSGSGARQLGGHRVGRDLPDAVEPLDEDVDLGAAPEARRPQRRIGPALLQPAHDAHGVGDDLAVVGLDHRARAPGRRARRRPSGRRGRRRPSRPGSTCGRGPAPPAPRWWSTGSGRRASVSGCTGRGRSCAPGRPRRRARAGARARRRRWRRRWPRTTSRPT